MLNFVFNKMWRRKWMVISLLLGNLLMIAIVSASPMYSQAVLQRMLMRDFSNYFMETNRPPGTIIVRNAYAGTKKEKDFDKISHAIELAEALTKELDIPVLCMVNQYYKDNVSALHQVSVENEKNEVSLKIASYSGVSDHVRIVNGETFSGELKGHTFDVIVNEKTFVTQNLMLGEELELTRHTDPSGIPYRIRISGIFENVEEQEYYWLSDPSAFGNVCLMDESLFYELFVNPSQMDKSFNTEWYAILDYTKIQGAQVEHYMGILDKYGEQFEDMGIKGFYTYFRPILETYLPKAQKLITTIWVLQLPIFVLLAAFIFMVSRQMMEMEQNEIAVYKSRGAGKYQILRIYLLQSLFIAVLGLAGGIPLGLLMCQILGSSNSFLEFVRRTALPVKMNLAVWGLSAGAAIFSVCTMVLPVFRYADVNIVAHKRQKNRVKKHSWWQLTGLDIILLGVSLYGLFQYHEQKEYLAQKVLDNAPLDPLLYFCSSLFMIGAGLLILRIFPWLVRLIFTLGKRWWPSSIYASFLRIIRTRSNQGFLMVFLILTVAMGIFNAQAARTINATAEERICYSIGADLVLQEVWNDNSQAVSEDTTGMLELTYQEPDFGKYLTLPGIERITKVLVDKQISVSVEGGKIGNVMLMGIHTKEFGETAWFKESLLPVHWYEYLNAISQNSQAILVSSNFQRIYGYKVGDILNYYNANGDSMRGIIYGFVDYWPGYAPVTRSRDSDGIYKETDNFLIVAHLAQLQSSWGITPYQIWIKTTDSSQFIYDYANDSGKKYSVFRDAQAELIALKNDPVFQGTNGILTVGFICILLLCTTGFLIYWILSIQSRTLQFGIFRAMGMTLREVLSMLINEQFFITGAAIAAGIPVGRLASQLFIPLLQIAYSTSDQVIPLKIISNQSDYVRLFAVIGAAILICIFILGWLISKIKIAQALKLGED